MVNGCGSSVLRKERRVHIKSSVFETRNHVRRNEKTKRSNYTQLELFGQDGFGRPPFSQRVLTRRETKKRRVRHHWNLRKGNIILATEVLDWRFNELTSVLALLIGGTYNLGS